MKITTFNPSVDYPYLAVYTGGEDFSLSKAQIDKIKNENIVMISMVEVEHGTDNVTYVQPLFGGKTGWITKNEKEYFPLPKGYSITIEQ